MAIHDARQAEPDRSLVPGIDEPEVVAEGGGRSARSIAARVVFVAALLGATVLFVYPLIWLLGASLKPPAEVFNTELIGSEIRWSNYTRLFDVAPILQWTWNSLIVTLLGATAVTVSSAMVAWGFAYFRFPHRNKVFALVLATMMLPGAVLMIPQFLIWDAIGLNNTLYPLWAGRLFASAFYVFLLRQFFLTLPRELFEAADIDGAGYPRMWWSVALPLTRAGLIVVFIFELKVPWTDLVSALIFLRDVELFTLTRGLKAIIDNPSIGGEQQWELLAAGSVIVTFPMVLIFFVFQRYFIEGIATTGSTGK